MDIYCPKCGEPTDMDSLHDEAQSQYGTPYYVPASDPYASRLEREQNPAYDPEAYGVIYKAVREKFQRVGCEALGMKHSEPRSDTDRTFGLRPQEAAAALYELLGDDMDGAAAMLDDMGY
jgi:hypothetical protein